ncbi:MAG: aspartyl/asparaginyl beta-hydroxylase protein [Gammaproteobacteria bacterium]|nr:aspartyl/asparaginyl beta-hydroxylase protein [Gammaproteobacteria bacterium]
MLDIPRAPILDKQALVGGCVRLPLAVDGHRLREEVLQLPTSVWGSTGGRVGVHSAAEALFLRGFAPAEGEKPIDDRPALALLPYVRHIIEELIAAPRLRCLLARLPAAGVIPPHVDRPPYFSKSLRIHVPIESNPQVYMVAAGLCYRMQPGEVWVLNNSATHAVWNEHPTSSRTHMICDFLPSQGLLDLLASGERNLGTRMLHVEKHLAETGHARAAAGA